MMRILIFRPDEIGDCVLFSGCLQAFRAQWPAARIDLMVQPPIRNLFALCPHVDRVLTTDWLFPWKWMQRRRMRGGWKLKRLVESNAARKLYFPRYDLVIYPVSAPTEEMLCAVRCLHASEKWGFGGFMFRQKTFQDLRNLPERVFTRCVQLDEAQHWVQELQRTGLFLQEMGIESDNLWPQFWLSRADEEFARKNIPEGQVLAIFPGASSKWRSWPTEKWREFLSRQSLVKRIVIFGGAEDRDWAREIMTMSVECGLKFTDLTGKTTLRQLVACIKLCAWVVSMETSGLHIAVACHIPTVGLTGGHHYGRYYPWGDPQINKVAKVEMTCFQCNRECDFGDYRCVPLIEVRSVLAAIGSISECGAATQSASQTT